ncbi:MAG: hypothetical protein IKZ61_04270 [Prevotella sp.]|jgi:hypothetical protein|nr:hypothetical protein [Prevotella sp.]
MKALDILLIICAMALLVVSYFIGNAELKALITFCAIMCGVGFGARWGGRQHQKNQENK